DLDSECRRPFRTSCGGERGPRRVQKDQIGLDDGRLAENAVERRDEHLAERMCLDMLPEKGEETTHHPLMGDARRGGHEQLPVVQLVPAAVGRERVVVAIRKDDASGHILRPRWKSITQSRRNGLSQRPVAEFTLADGTTIRRDVSECRVQVEGQTATSPVVLGGPDDAPLLGAVTLETLGLMVNPLTRELLPMRLMLADASGRNWAPALLPS